MDPIKIPESLKQALQAGKLVPFVGAGVSMAVQGREGQRLFPGWGDLLNISAVALDGENKPAPANAIRSRLAYIEDDSYLRAAQIAQKELGKQAFNQLIKQQLDHRQAQGDPATLAVAQQLWQLGSKLLITTNYDKVLDWSCPPEWRDDLQHWAIEAPFEQQQAISDGIKHPTVWHLHGQLSNINQIVLTSDGYQSLYTDGMSEKTYKAALATLKHFLAHHSLLFVGFSFADEVFYQQLKQVSDCFDGNSHQHYVLVKAGQEAAINALGLPLIPVGYPSHDDLPQVLAQLVELTPAAALPDAVIAARSVQAEIQPPDIFVGREQELQQLQQLLDALSQPDSGQLIHLSGIGGIGKTTLARETMSRCGEQFPDGCFEIRFAALSPQDFTLKLAGLLGLPVPELADDQQATALVGQWLNQYRLLLLLDNVDDSQALLRVLPQRCQSSIIITSRDRDLSALLRLKRRHLTVSHFELQGFNDTETLALFHEFLHEQYQATDETDYLAIAAQLGFLPIALRLALSLMVFGPGYSPRQLLSQLQSGDTLKLLDAGKAEQINADERAIAAIFDLSMPMLTAPLQQTLAELAVCAPGPVPVDFLKQLSKQAELTGSLNLLVRYNWCWQYHIGEVSHYELHQLVRELIQRQWVDDGLKAQHTGTVQELFIDQPQHFSQLERWLSQTDPAVLWLKAQQDRRLIDWAGEGFYQFCANRGHGARFITLCQWVIDSFNTDKMAVAMALGNQAGILQARGELEQAMGLYQQQETIYSVLNNPTGLASCYLNRAAILQTKGEWDQAMVLLQQHEAIHVELGNQAGLSRSYGNQAVILQHQGKQDQAMVLLQKQQAICQALGDRVGLAANYCNQAGILKDKGERDRAMVLHLQQQEICQALGDKSGLARSYAGQALILQDQGNPDQAMALHQQEEALCKALGDRAQLSQCYGNQARIWFNKGKLDQAMVLYQKEEAICAALSTRPQLSRCYGNQAKICYRRGELDQAMVLFQKAVEIFESLGDKAQLSRIYLSQGMILARKGELDQAMALYQQQQTIAEALDDQAGLANSYNNQAIILLQQDEPDQSMALLQKSEAIYRALDDQAGLERCYNTQALVSQRKAELAQAAILTEAQAQEGLTGVEAEQTFNQHEPFDPQKISIASKVVALDTVLRRLKNQTIQLSPDFQRESVWDMKTKSLLIESMMLKVPLPMFYVAEDPNGVWEVVDGLQRLTAIRDFILGEANDGKGYRLQGLEFWGEAFDGRTFDDIANDPKANRIVNNIMESELSFTIINPDTPEAVKRNIFKRINTGGMNLSMQEIRHALYQGPATRLLKELVNSTAYAEYLGQAIKDDRMAGRELLLRFIAFYLFVREDYSGDMDDFLAAALRVLNGESVNKYTLVTAIDFADIRAKLALGLARSATLFGEHAYRRSLSGVRTAINQALFELWNNLLVIMSDRDFALLTANRPAFLQNYKTLLNDEDFINAISRHGSTSNSTLERFDRINKMIQDFIESVGAVND